ncbi:MAG: transposase [Chloroflexi bacterium]|nr:transposase [Chloroflexota bacterium]
MTKRVLILTPSPGFGELIRQVLEETGDLYGLLAYQAEQALVVARQGGLALAVVDGEFGEDLLISLVEQIRQESPGLRLILIPQDEGQKSSNLASLAADVTLPSPFYLPDLNTAVEELFGVSQKKRLIGRKGRGAPPRPARNRAHTSEAAPEWLQDVSLAAQYLTRLSLESASQAALVTRGDKVWAYAGELPREAAVEVAAAVARHWDEDGGADLARFLHLESTQADYMLYATGLGGDFALAVVFDAEISFSKMRSQASELAQALANAPESALAELGRSQSSMSEAGAHFENSSEPGGFDDLNYGGSNESLSPIFAKGSPEKTSRNADAHAQATVKANGHLLFSYVLIPRLPNHQLQGDLSTRLALWLPQLCVAFAWRLESMNIQSGFLQWTVSLPVDTTPQRVARVLEAQLSKWIFNEFARLERDNPSGEFWAPGALIVNGSQPSSAQILAFIKQTRAQQGIPSNE